jgi:hypothetical protein
MVNFQEKPLMNSIVSQQFGVLRDTMALRNQLMDILTDDDLRYKLPGHNSTLGELCRLAGQVEVSYIQSFKTFRQDFKYTPVEAALASHVDLLKAWYAELDSQLLTALENLSEDDIQNRKIDRIDIATWSAPPTVQLHVYREALLIFYGKVSIYLKALEKTLPGLWPAWIA